ncbi:D-inositol-3-phosphate glycosyltransferase [bioreactor metagenome]|uniref:D-inositol-3-phosphate glycosyltransferase n=2 Tax=root TaxID=1 RepID=A0A645BMG7_9ZZZZ
MRTAGLLIAPCDIEGLGLTVVEAMAVGLPVVACAAGGHLETVGAATAGALYPVGDLSAGADLVRCLAVDDERRVAYGAELAQIQSTRFTVEAQVAGVDAVYRAVLS